MSPFELLAALVTGVVIGIATIVSLAKWAETTTKKTPSDKPLDDTPLRLAMEEYCGILYVFKSDTEEFVCQGASVEEVQAAFNLRYPANLGIVVRADDRVVNLLKERGMSVAKDN